MKVSATRVALVAFLLGALGVWLIRPIGDPCPDLGKLPAGSASTSAPSFAPPLTRTCTYTTAGGIDAHQRYVPVIDWIVLAVLAGVVGLGVALLGGSGSPRAAGRRASSRPPRLAGRAFAAAAAAPSPRPAPQRPLAGDARAGPASRAAPARAATRRRVRGRGASRAARAGTPAARPAARPLGHASGWSRRP